MFDIIIVGAGTAGMTAAIYGARAGKKVLILEEKSYGGQIINSPEIENYPGIKKISGFDFATGLYEQMISLDVTVAFEKVLSIDPKEKKVKTKKQIYLGKSIILAVGAKRRPLGIAREEELIGKGISYCATCDGPLYKDKEVAIVGGGNTALEDASFLSNYCKKVYLIHRRNEFRGETHLVSHLDQRNNIIYLLNSNVTELIGDNTLDAIRILNHETKEEKILDVSGLFITIGQIPASEEFKDTIRVDENQYIIANEDCKTNIEGVFTAGDCRTKLVRQLATAASDGATAALLACQYLESDN